MTPRCRKMKFVLRAVVLRTEVKDMLPGPLCTWESWRKVEGAAWPMRCARGREEARGSGVVGDGSADRAVGRPDVAISA